MSKTVKVKSVLPGSPAERCRKIVAGDELLSESDSVCACVFFESLAAGFESHHVFVRLQI